MLLWFAAPPSPGVDISGGMNISVGISYLSVAGWLAQGTLGLALWPSSSSGYDSFSSLVRYSCNFFINLARFSFAILCFKVWYQTQRPTIADIAHRDIAIAPNVIDM